MTQDEIYNVAAAYRRAGCDAYVAVSKAFSKAGCVGFSMRDKRLKTFLPGDENVYIQCNGFPPHSIRTIDFVVGAQKLTWEIVSIDNVPFIHVFKKTFGT